MFGTKIRSWMEAHLARSRAKRKEKATKPVVQQSTTQQESFAAALDASAAFFVGTRHADFNEILPALALSPSHHHYVKVHHEDIRRYRHPPPRHHPPPPPPPSQHHQVLKSTTTDPQQQQQQRTSAVNLSSPESAYSTGYSTDGTSPCATYAPEYYINVRPQQQQQPQQHTRVEQVARNGGREQHDRIDSNTGTYTVRGRLLDTEQQHHPWRKPAPPTAGLPVQTNSPKIQNGGYLVRNKPYSTSADCNTGIGSTTGTGYPLQLFSPRRMPLVATTTTQVMPVKSPRQRSRVRTNPWPNGRNAAMMVGGTASRPWSRQQMYNNGGPAVDYCCRQESLSVGRSPVNRTDWRSLRQLRQQQQLQHRTAKGRTSSSASSCSSRSRSRSCSVSSTASSSASNPASNDASSPSSDDITLNEVMGKFDENYLYEKETDIVSDHSNGGNEIRGGRDTSCCSSTNFSSDASASSLDLQHDSGGSSSRSTSRQRLRGLSGRRQRRRRHRRSVESKDDEAEKEHREEVELLQEVINRRFKKNSNEAAAQTNRALLERLLMKNASSGYEGRRAWSANPAPMRSAASRSVGGTPICLRRETMRASHLLSPPSRMVFERNHQVYPAESTSSLKNMSASELALIEADKEADLKYAQLIMEAERMLLNAQQQLEREESVCSSRRGSSASVTADSSTASRRLYPQSQQASAPNKRVELIKNAELNIELALSKSRNSQPELSSGSIKDLLDHSSPKRLLQQQQKKIIEPVVTQAVASTQTTENNFTSFHSLDVNPAAILKKSASPSDELCSTSEHYSCPQSEPVKRKVYEAQEAGRLLQYQQAPWLRNSDGDCANDQQQLQQQLQSASAASSYSQLRKHMLIETLQGLKQSLEDQSAALKMSCLRPL